MSPLKALLKDVPVEWKELKEVCIDFIVPMRDRPKTFEGPIPWCRIEDIEDKYFNKSKLGLGVSNDIIRNMNLKVFPTGTVICSCSASIGVYAINTQPLITNQTFIGLVCGSNLYNRYLLYFMETQTASLLKLATTGTIPYISRKKFEDFKVSIPYPNDPEKSLVIQQEIVKVLDGLSEQQKALTTALAQEIDQRKKQYAYYLEALFRFEGKEVEWKTLGDENVGKFTRGSGLQKKDFTEFGVGCIHYGQVYTYYNTYAYETKSYVSVDFAKNARKAKTGDLVIATTSENDEDVCKAVAWLGKEDIAVSSDACFYSHTLNSKYVAYYFQTEHFQKQKRKYITGTKVRRVNVNDLEKITIPNPVITEQERIVGLLDQYDEATKNLVAQLEKEIKLRNQQYEYYRDLLLRFE